MFFCFGINMTSRIRSLEAILSAVMCLCSSYHDDTSTTVYTKLVDHGMHTNQKDTVLLDVPEIQNIEEELSRLKETLQEIQQENIKILSALAENKSSKTAASITLKIFEQCPLDRIGLANEIIYIQINTYPEVFPIVCTGNDHGGNWMIIQQRYDGSEDFFRTWQEYQSGFGSLKGELFIGLDKLHALTTARPRELLILMQDFDDNRKFAYYSRFEIGNATEEYALKVLGNYRGDAGDSLRRHLLQKFSTFDRDNDIYEANCAIEYTGAWWYDICHTSNLNGQYLKGALSAEKHAKGMSWSTFRGLEYSLKAVQIMIRDSTGTLN